MSSTCTFAMFDYPWWSNLMTAVLKITEINHFKVYEQRKLIDISKASLRIRNLTLDSNSAWSVYFVNLVFAYFQLFWKNSRKDDL